MTDNQSAIKKYELIALLTVILMLLLTSPPSLMPEIKNTCRYTQYSYA
jgi:hypothetical protein